MSRIARHNLNSNTWAPSRGGVQRPPRSLGPADTRRGPAPPEPPSCSLRGRCGDDQVGASDAGPGPAGGFGAVDLETERAGLRQAGRNLRWARVPLTGPALEFCGLNFAKSVMRQGLCGPTPHHEILNITLARRIVNCRLPRRFALSAAHLRATPNLGVDEALAALAGAVLELSLRLPPPVPVLPERGSLEDPVVP